MLVGKGALVEPKAGRAAWGDRRSGRISCRGSEGDVRSAGCATAPAGGHRRYAANAALGFPVAPRSYTLALAGVCDR